MSDKDIVLKVAFKDKEKAKALGARWNAELKQWYVPAGRDLVPFAAWLETPPPAPELVGETAPAKGVRLASLLADVAVAVAERFRAPVWVQAEVVKIDERPNGIVYLELRDGAAKARAMIWSDTARQVIPKFEKATGMVLGPNLKLLVQAQVRFHAEHGFGLTISDIDPEYSLGDLEAKKREILRVLKEEGVLDANRSLAAPWDFNRVLVCAPQGAAGLGDFLAEAKRLEGICHFQVVHARFQGEGAPGEIVRVISQVLRECEELPDAVIVIRGGGAVNDLAWLNDLTLTRYLATLPVPVITGIGHERDGTTLDVVANQCCDTPSKAIAHVMHVIRSRTDEAKANFRVVIDLARRSVAAPRESLAKHLAVLETGARRQVFRAREGARAELHSVHTEARAALADARSGTSHALKAIQTAAVSHVREVKREISRSRETLVTEPPRRLVELRGKAKSAIEQLHAHALSRTRQARTIVVASHEAIMAVARSRVRQARREMTEAIAAIESTAQEHTQRARDNSRSLLNEIVAMGPQKSLRRGFAIVRDADGAPVTRAEAVKAKDALLIEFQDGTVNAVAESSTRTKE